MNKSYSYIVLNASSSTFTAVNSSSSNPGTLNFFPGGDITITNGNSKRVSSNIGYVYGAFLTVTVSGTSVTANGGFSSAEQQSGLSCEITCQLVFKAYMN